MRIDFFEEYPTSENLARAREITWPSTIYLAARSLTEFAEAKERLATVNPALEPAYWPILSQSYWVSPFSSPQDLVRLHDELLAYQGERLKVVIDLELPLMRPALFIKNLLLFFRNKRLLTSIFSQTHRFDISIAQYPPVSALVQNVIRWCGVPDDSYDLVHIPMYYSSMIRSYDAFIPGDAVSTVRQNLSRMASAQKARMHIGLGAIARGALGNEAILSPAKLGDDLAFVRDSGFPAAVIFRLGGLNEQYMSVIKEFV